MGWLELSDVELISDDGKSEHMGTHIMVPELPKLDPGKRGLILGPPTLVDDHRVLIKRNLDRQEIRLAALLWDQIFAPTFYFDGWTFEGDAEFLEQEGVLSHVHIGLMGKMETSEFFKQSISIVVERLTKEGNWALAQGDRALTVLAADGAENSGIDFELYKAIPVPDRGVPLAEVLDFKLKREAELKALRARLDEVHQIILDAPDRALARGIQLDALEKAIEDHLRVAREWRYPSRLTSLRAKLKLDPKINYSKLTAAGGVANATYLATGSLAKAAASAVGQGLLMSVGLEPSWAKAPDQTNPYRYVSKFHSELLGPASITDGG
jgi:hypothetical protein